MQLNTSTSRRLKVSVFACAVLAMGLLLWARFLLVTGHPRTAIADPTQQRQVVAPPIETHE